MKIRSDLQAIYGNAAAAFDDVGKRIDGIEKTKAGQNKGYIPIKNLISKEYNDHGDGWRQWQDDLLDFLNCSDPGMRSFPKEIEAQTEEWMQMMKVKYGAKSHRGLCTGVEGPKEPHRGRSEEGDHEREE